MLRQRDPSEPPGRIIDTYGVELAVTERQIADIAEENARSEIKHIAEDDGFFYSENEEEFRQFMNNAQNYMPEYEYENALNGSRNTFGLEIEFVGGSGNLRDMGACQPSNTKINNKLTVLFSVYMINLIDILLLIAVYILCFYILLTYC